MHSALLSALVLVLGCLGACGNDAGTSPAGASVAAAASEQSPDANSAGTSDATSADASSQAAPAQAPAAADDETPAEFDPVNVPESSATLPPFPFFKAPEGLISTLDDKDRNKRFDRQHMIAGNKIIAVEGKVFHDQFALTNPEQRDYSAIEFQRNYADAISALGGVEVGTVQYTDEVNAAFGGRDEVDKHYIGACAGFDCENHTYLLRQAGNEYWIQVSSGAIPLHGYVVVLERQVMTSKLAFLSADAMKRKLDADGRVALYINFDTDKATLRPDATPVVNEIAKLLQANPALKLSIDGHTDATGTAERNRVLSKERAESVRSALVAKGIDAERLGAQGFGPDKPLAGNDDETGRARNRRVELVKQ